MSDKTNDELLIEAAGHLQALASYLTDCSNYFKRFKATAVVALEMHKNAQTAKKFSNTLAVRARKCQLVGREQGASVNLTQSDSVEITL